MENQEKNTLDRVLKEQHFEIAKKAVEGGKKSGTLKNPELIEELIEKFKADKKAAQSELTSIIVKLLKLKDI